MYPEDIIILNVVSSGLGALWELLDRLTVEAVVGKDAGLGEDERGNAILDGLVRGANTLTNLLVFQSRGLVELDEHSGLDRGHHELHFLLLFLQIVMRLGSGGGEWKANLLVKEGVVDGAVTKVVQPGKLALLGRGGVPLLEELLSGDHLLGQGEVGLLLKGPIEVVEDGHRGLN